MNYPLWDLPASGLLIAVVAVLHVFVSHFAVGGGLFLVLTERRARRTGDAALLAYVERHTRFFVLLTLVIGAVTGVGIWFTIGLVHPAATSALIQLFVWFWAIEWVFFATEIAAALVYYYGWNRLRPAAHERVGWIYAGSSWMSLAVINGILSFMLTPGDWPVTGNVWSAFFNPTYVPALVARTAAAVGLAGLYALLTASWMTSGALKVTLARYAGLRWVLPMAVVLPLSLAWYLAAAANVGIDVAGVIGIDALSPGAMWQVLVSESPTGYPIARLAAIACVASGLALVMGVVAGVLSRPAAFGPATVAPLLLCGLVAFGGAEFVREDLRKPYVIGEFMFVNGLRRPLPWTHTTLAQRDGAFTMDRVNATGLLASAKYVGPGEVLSPSDAVTLQDARGHAVFRVLCAACHTVDGHLAIRPLVRGRQVAALEGVIERLAVPVDADGQAAAWSTPGVRLVSWRGRRMPPFAGTPEERRDLAVHLALLGGANAEDVARQPGNDEGKGFFEENCGMCHSPDGQWAFEKRPHRDTDTFYELLGRLPEINEMMPPFPGNDAQRRAVASHLATLTAGNPPATDKK